MPKTAAAAPHATTVQASGAGVVAPSRAYAPAHNPISPMRREALVARRAGAGMPAARPYPREAMAAASASDRSRASWRTGETTVRMRFAGLRLVLPRKALARRTRPTLSTSWGATERATTTATLTS
jgi:hypothetical protein